MDIALSFSGATFVLFCFVSLPLSASFFVYYVSPFFCFFSEVSLFPSIFAPLFPFSRCMQSKPYVFPRPDGLVLPRDHGLDF